MGWAYIGPGGGDREGFVKQVRVFKLPIDAKSPGNACVFPCLEPGAR